MLPVEMLVFPKEGDACALYVYPKEIIMFLWEIVVFLAEIGVFPRDKNVELPFGVVLFKEMVVFRKGHGCILHKNVEEMVVLLEGMVFPGVLGKAK